MEIYFPFQLHNKLWKSNSKRIPNMLTFYQQIFISKMEWVPSKSLFWRGNDSTEKLIISIRSGASLVYRPCYENMLRYDNDNQFRKLTTI